MNLNSSIPSTSSIQTIPSNQNIPQINSPNEPDEDTVICQLISQYLQSKNLKLSTLAFNNETGITKKANKTKLPEGFDLYQVLRTSRLYEQSSSFIDDFSTIRKETEDYKNKIIQLEKENNQLKNLLNKQQTDPTNQNQNDTNNEQNQTQNNEQNQTQNNELNNETNEIKNNLTSTLNTSQNSISFNSVQESPSVALLNSVFADIMQLMNVIDSNERRNNCSLSPTKRDANSMRIVNI